MLRLWLWAAVITSGMVLLRPPAGEWPEAVASLRRKQRHGSLAASVQVVQAAWADRQWQGVRDLAWRRAAVRQHEWADASSGKPLWAVDLAVASVGCTHRVCYIGVLGEWRRPAAEADLYALLAVHALACYFRMFDPGAYWRYFSPAWSRPLSVPASLFATGGVWEVVWLASLLGHIGNELQRRIGRLGFLALYGSGGGIATLLALLTRHSTSGGGGALACCAFHALQHPTARHSIFGVGMGANAALAVQLALACLPSLQGRVARPALGIALNVAPVVVGAALWRSRALS